MSEADPSHCGDEPIYQSPARRYSLRKLGYAQSSYPSLHGWSLDVHFAEDASRTRKMASGQIAAGLRRAAVNILSLDTQLDKALSGKMKKASWNNDCLESLLLKAQAL